MHGAPPDALGRAVGRSQSRPYPDELKKQRLLARGWLRYSRTVWNGIDLGLFRPDGDDGAWHSRLGVAPGAPLVVHLARFDPIKRHADLVEAARLVHAAHPDAVFVLAGHGPLLGQVQDLARLARACASWPTCPMSPRCCGRLSVFVLPSLHEAAPLALLEAMACGCACVCTRVGGVPAMRDDGRPDGPCGLLVPPGNPPALAAVITQLLADGGLRAALGGRGLAPPRPRNSPSSASGRPIAGLMRARRPRRGGGWGRCFLTLASRSQWQFGQFSANDRAPPDDGRRRTACPAGAPRSGCPNGR